MTGPQDETDGPYEPPQGASDSPDLDMGPDDLAGPLWATFARPEDGPQPTGKPELEIAETPEDEPDLAVSATGVPDTTRLGAATARPVTATAFLNMARTQVGYQEGPNNSTKYGVWFGWNNVRYCAIGLSWVAGHTGALHLMGGKFASCQLWVQRWKRVGRWIPHTGTPRRGDLVFFDWSGRHGIAQHVGVVERIDNGVLCTIEFNTLSGLDGDQSDGGGVYQRRRATLYVVGYGRPAWAPEQRVRPAPRPSRDGRGLLPLVVDGDFGPNTVRRLQRWVGVPEDGKAGPRTWRAVQAKIGMPAASRDGVPGPRTYKALQRYLRIPQTGRFDRVTVRALQRMLNRRVLRTTFVRRALERVGLLR